MLKRLDSASEDSEALKSLKAVHEKCINDTNILKCMPEGFDHKVKVMCCRKARRALRCQGQEACGRRRRGRVSGNRPRTTEG